MRVRGPSAPQRISPPAITLKSQHLSRPSHLNFLHSLLALSLKRNHVMYVTVSSVNWMSGLVTLRSYFSLTLQSVCLSRDEPLAQLTSAYLHTSSLTLLNLIAVQSWILTSARDRIIVVHVFAAFVICFISSQGGQCPSPRDRHIELDFRHLYNSAPPVLSRPCPRTPQSVANRLSVADRKPYSSQSL